ncbi:hypothetical protein [uncultured Campylobacter sp.]|uniref:hypothetical protein n=1 Tax=uncultured Campylobacter sp. TaxID=218934 RepID=UPI0026077198|nr:hypothetical protein [uncultured Campylobacter sp.]
MADLKEEIKWENGIYQLETVDLVVGGVDGISNKQAKQLANRTSYLKKQIEDNKSGADLALATKRDVNDSYSKTEVDKKFTDTGKLIKEKLGKSETAADSEKLGGVAAKEFMQKDVYKPNNESSANSLVLRDSNGDFAGRYITAGHFRFQAPNQNNLFGSDRELLFRVGSAENDNYVRAVGVPYAASVMGVLGINQTWQSVTHLRQAGVTYTNTTGRPIMVSITSHCLTGGSSNLIIDGVGLCITGGGAAVQSSATGIVPNGSTYKYQSFSPGNDFLDNWHELR